VGVSQIHVGRLFSLRCSQRFTTIEPLRGADRPSRSSAAVHVSLAAEQLTGCDRLASNVSHPPYSRSPKLAISF
jgi:hypothetical protein